MIQQKRHERLRLLSLCSGIGMIDYVWSHMLGQEIAGQVEIKPYCQALLTERWPGVPKVRDIKEVIDGDPFGAVDVVAGGVPCQPFSNSGKRRGTDDNRHLWPSAFAIVQRRKPTWVLIENVAGFVSLALDLVQTDLESADYQSRAYVLPACAVGAPHIRERVFILAHTTSSRSQIRQEATQFSTQSYPSGDDLADTYSFQQRIQPEQQSQCKSTSLSGNDGAQGTLAHSNRQRCQQDGDRQPQPGMGRELDGLADWMDRTHWPALPGEPQYEWEPPRTIARRVPHHGARLESLGNAIVPQQIYPFLKFVLEYERGRI